MSIYSFATTVFTASIIGLNYAFATSPPNTEDVFAVNTGNWITAVYALTLATNVVATGQPLNRFTSCPLLPLYIYPSGLLAYRIWRVSRRAAEFIAPDRLAVIFHVVLESGTIYSVTVIAALITFLAGSPVVYVLLDIVSFRGRHLQHQLTDSTLTDITYHLNRIQHDHRTRRPFRQQDDGTCHWYRNWHRHHFRPGVRSHQPWSPSSGPSSPR